MGYRKKDYVALTYEANKKRLRAEGSIILAIIMNEAIAEMDAQFADALNEGEVLNISGSPEEMRAFLRHAAERELGAKRVLNGKK